MNVSNESDPFSNYTYYYYNYEYDYPVPDYDDQRHKELSVLPAGVAVCALGFIINVVVFTLMLRSVHVWSLMATIPFCHRNRRQSLKVCFDGAILLKHCLPL